jgi:hypothetical protein
MFVADQTDLRQAPPDRLIMRTIALEPLHGWAIAHNRRARFYSLTRAGRKQLTTEVSTWERLSAPSRC